MRQIEHPERRYTKKGTKIINIIVADIIINRSSPNHQSFAPSGASIKNNLLIVSKKDRPV
jgi:hypothetical protein